MSKHTWLTKPTEAKAEQLFEYFDFALKYQSAYLADAAILAGAVLERLTQAGVGRYDYSTAGERVIEASARSGFRVLRSRNAGNYYQTFKRHLPFFEKRLRAYFADLVDLAPDSPWQVVADKLEEEESEDDANFLRDLYR